MAKTLNEIVVMYLKANGIKSKHFSSFIGTDYSICIRWLKGNIKTLYPSQIEKVHLFLNGAWIKNVSDVYEEEKNE